MVELNEGAVQTRTRRKRRGMTQASLADALGCSQARVSQLETGQVLPTLEESERIRELLKVRPRAWLNVATGQGEAKGAV